MIEIQSLIRLAVYYRWFVEGLSTIAEPLTQLTPLDILFILFKESELRFRKLKEFLATSPILTLSLEGERFMVYNDASIVDLVCLLMKHIPVIAYVLQLYVHEHNYALMLCSLWW
ncbi:hypothetical protein MTR67_002637 [Solanum verrucosum]|uniref:Uncharacterized protein n=1 Tax=Solanum verrucosum TaxID=315347 RepID=A0AAF0PQZ0_SOLVR|nr:hypothetical protein MTR67_002637 [Solanum verrucosum]